MNSLKKIVFLKKQSRIDSHLLFNLLLDHLYNLNCYVSDFLLYYNVGIYFISSERSFCGNFNSLLVQAIFFFLEGSFFSTYDSFKLFCFGRKGRVLCSQHFATTHLHSKFFLKRIKIENSNSYDFFSFFLRTVLYNCANLDIISTIFYSG